MKEELSFDLPKHKSSKIKVIGVGGGGNNAVNYMYAQGIIGVDFVVCNTDAQALESSPVPAKIQLGATTTEGLGAGANPEIGELSAIETLEKIKEVLETNTKMVFITAGMGGGTGTGAAPIIAKCARDLGILTVGIVTIPFKFEGEKRYEYANQGLEKLRQNVDSLIVINNNKLRELYGNLGYKAGFAKSDEILANAAKGIAEIITQNYQVNIDLNDVKKVLSDSGTAIMGSSTGEGPNRAQDAISKALDSPLLNDNKITGAKNVLLLIVSGKNEITMDEIAIINEYIQSEAGNNAHIIMGIGEDLNEDDKIMVMVVATGFKQEIGSISNPARLSLNDVKNEITSNQFVDGNKIRYTLEDEEEKKNKILTEQTIFKQTEEEEISFELTTKTIENQIVETKIEEPSLNTVKDELGNYDVLSISDKEVIDEVITFEVINKNEENISYERPIDVEITNEIPHEIKFERKTLSLFDTSEGLDNQENERKVNVVESQQEINFIQQSNIIREIKFEEENNPISVKQGVLMEQNIAKTIAERREKLKSFNTKYINANQLNELEKVPAYMRSGIQFDANTSQNSSGFYFDNKDGNIKPNNFLNRNVD
jgi:cell division protein FtsZ